MISQSLRLPLLLLLKEDSKKPLSSKLFLPYIQWDNENNHKSYHFQMKLNKSKIICNP